MGEMETQAGHELITWNIMEDQVAENREARKTGEPEKEHSAKRKGRAIGPNCHSVIPLNCHHTGRLKNTGSKAINTRSRDLRWPVTDSSKNSSVPIRKLSKRTSSQIVQKIYRERDASP